MRPKFITSYAHSVPDKNVTRVQYGIHHESLPAKWDGNNRMIASLDEKKTCKRAPRPALKARLELRDTRRGYLDVVLGFSATKSSDQIPVFSANDHTAFPSEFPRHGRAHLATAVF